MAILPRKRLRRHAASRPAPCVNLPSFTRPERPDAMATGAIPEARTTYILAVADRVGELLGRPVTSFADVEVVTIGGDAILYAFGVEPGRATWFGDAYKIDDDSPLGSVDTGLSTDPDVYRRLGAETMARGIVAAVKRFERERLNFPDRCFGADSTGADVYESDEEDIGRFRAASAEAADDERSAREEWERK